MGGPGGVRRQPPGHRVASPRRQIGQERFGAPAGQPVEQYFLSRGQPIQEPHESGRVGRSHVGDARRGKREQEHHIVAALVVLDLGHFWRHDEPSPQQCGKRGVELPRHGAHGVSRVEPPLCSGAHDAEGGAVEGGRARAVLQIGERRLLVAVQSQHRARDGHVLGRARGAARLRVEERRLRRQRRRPGPPLGIDVPFKVVVALHRHAALIVARGPAVRESVRAPERRVSIRLQQAPQHRGLC